MQLYSWYISWASSAFWKSPHAALCSQRRCCLPTINWATTGLVFTSQEEGMCSAYLFNRRRTAPPGAHLQQHTREGQLAGQVYGYSLVWGKRSKQSLRVDPGHYSLQYHAVCWTISPCSHMLSTALLLFASLQICKRLHGPCTSWQSCLLIAMFT